MSMVERVAESQAFFDGCCLTGMSGERREVYMTRAWLVISDMREPTEAMTDAARHLMMWLDFERPTEAALLAHCKRLGKAPPPECRDVDHVPPKALRLSWIFRAMIDADLSKEEERG